MYDTVVSLHVRLLYLLQPVLVLADKYKNINPDGKHADLKSASKIYQKCRWVRCEGVEMLTNAAVILLFHPGTFFFLPPFFFFFFFFCSGEYF